MYEGNDGEPSHPEGLSLVSGLRGKVCLFFFLVFYSLTHWILPTPIFLCISNCGFILQFVSLIDGMINDCSSEASRLARELTKTQGKLSELEAMMKAVEDSHSAKVSKLKV